MTELLPEWRCPACGAVTRARMADVATPDGLRALTVRVEELREERDGLIRVRALEHKEMHRAGGDIRRLVTESVQLKARIAELEDRELQLQEQAGEMAEELVRLRRTSIVDRAYVGQEIKVEFEQGE